MSPNIWGVSRGICCTAETRYSAKCTSRAVPVICTLLSSPSTSLSLAEKTELLVNFAAFRRVVHLFDAGSLMDVWDRLLYLMSAPSKL